MPYVQPPPPSNFIRSKQIHTMELTPVEYKQFFYEERRAVIVEKGVFNVGDTIEMKGSVSSFYRTISFVEKLGSGKGEKILIHLK